MMDLIEAIENAKSPDRLLDAAIEVELRRWQAYEIGLSDKVRSHWNPVGSKGEVICTQGLTRYHSPIYTFEIDKALLLVPVGWEWSISNRAPAPNTGRAYLNNKQPIYAGVGSRKNPKFASEEVVAATPALALCATALRVRAHALTSQPRGSEAE